MTEVKKFENPKPAVHHTIALWAANCAEHVLNIFETNRPDDERPRLAITTLREWAEGKRTMVSCREAAFASHAAARAAGQAVTVAHMYTHAPHAADYAAKAVMLAAPKEAASDTWAQERRWQHEQLQEDLWSVGFPKGD